MRLWVELIVSGLITGGIYALVAMGLNLQYGLMRILNVSHGEFLMLGAYLTYWAHLVTHANPLLFLPGVLAGLFGLGIVIHRPASVVWPRPRPRWRRSRPAACWWASASCSSSRTWRC